MGFSRRDLLAASGLAALGSLPFLGNAAVKRRRVLRIAHITDIHVMPERSAALGMERCLEHAQGQNADIIFMGGDMVMDTLMADKDRVKAQWDVYKNVLRANRAVPVVHALGNHDIWGWGDKQRLGSEAGFGKAYAMDRLHMSRPYSSFDRAGWHFVVLDSIHESRMNGYFAGLGRAQFEWLADDLKSVPKDRPVLVMSHVPIISAAAFFHGQNERTGNWHVPGAWMHVDARLIKDLFAQHPNVKTCISGHIHLNDKIEYQGVEYIGTGAGCAAWWGGPFQGVGNGYSIVDLFNDGSVENRYVEYGWKPVS
jgi:Icc protein